MGALAAGLSGAAQCPPVDRFVEVFSLALGAFVGHAAFRICRNDRRIPAKKRLVNKNALPDAGQGNLIRVVRADLAPRPGVPQPDAQRAEIGDEFAGAVAIDVSGQ